MSPISKSSICWCKPVISDKYIIFTSLQKNNKNKKRLKNVCKKLITTSNQKKIMITTSNQKKKENKGILQQVHTWSLLLRSKKMLKNLLLKDSKVGRSRSSLGVEFQS